MKTENQTSVVFHLAIPTHDLEQAEAFYTQILGAETARRYEDRITLKFFGNQIVCHFDPDGCETALEIYPRHFGITFLDFQSFADLYGKFNLHPECLFKALSIRYGDKPERHQYFFVRDPSNNLLEFKHYDDPLFVY